MSEYDYEFELPGGKKGLQVPHREPPRVLKIRQIIEMLLLKQQRLVDNDKAEEAAKYGISKDQQYEAYNLDEDFPRPFSVDEELPHGRYAIRGVRQHEKGLSGRQQLRAGILFQT
jgi:hypothetical protein